MCNGFKLIPESDTSYIDDYELDNYSSATCPEFKPEMDLLFSQELTLGRISKVDSKPRCVHPIGRVPKKDSGKSRPITDCSRPFGKSLNDHIKQDLNSFRMNSIDDAVSFSSPYCFYWIVDNQLGAGSRCFPLIENYRVFAGCSGNTILCATTITWITDFVSVSRASLFSTDHPTLSFA